ncbi:UvrD-helicase domain-containing protein [Paenibacillus sp. MBLB2552]|uniref:UvrD-helicase domain-containing protein n=1 Tax=Paenibacillus mellifer TaxID=2937794 RepID=A0A9X2BPN6_9BACL|nr:UvrD-helicase domain-containing protein [Paenibacillus mellifer]MCK8487067.1 UvrD-helicase domain-containing protein [Paenibacillus mellifer]
MYFNQDDFDLVEKTILGNKRFNENQREFIELMESKYIIAGPGVGKTTCLAAKIVLLLMKLASSNSKDAVCIITQTNVAVDEINKILRRLGLAQINHPHFVGTVHQFFNTFLAIPYIKKHINPINLRFAEDDDYSSLISTLVHKNSYFGGWSSGPKSAVIRKIQDCNLIYDKKTDKIILENTVNWDRFERHHTHMFNVKWELKRLGFFTFNDTFLFAEAALGYRKNISLLRKRFKYVFIDEFQDTKASSLAILKNIFSNEGNVLQVVGDPNQTLDFYGQMPSVDNKNKFELKICNRFGDEIAKHLPNIINGIQVECFKEKKSFNPLLILYNRNEQLIPYYKKIFTEYLADENFSRSTKKDSILSIRKLAINGYQTDGNHQSVTNYKIKNSESYTGHISKLVNDLIYNKLSNIEEFEIDYRQWVREHPKQTDIKKCLIKGIKRGQLDKDSLKIAINSILIEKDSGAINATNAIFGKISSVLELINNSDVSKINEDDDQTLIFGTIHSAKGETHRSVLLIDSEEADMIHSKMLKSFYCLDNTNYDNEWVERNLLYVAMSRPTHLFAFGMNASYINQDEINIFRDKGWDIKFAFDESEQENSETKVLNMYI